MKRINTNLIPCYQVTAVPSLSGYWQAEGIDPQFEIQHNSKPIHLRRGYCAIEIENKDGLQNIYNPILFYDTGSGYASERKIDLVFQLVRAGVYRAYFILPEDAVAFRFDPTEIQGRFHIGKLRMMRYLRMGWYISAARLVLKERRAQGQSLSVYTKKASDIIRNEGFRALAAKVRNRVNVPIGTSAQSLNDGHSTGAGLNPTRGSVGGHDKYFGLFCDYSQVAEGYRDPLFAADRAEAVDSSKSDVKLIAYYLPQFHPFEQNDRWWGKGFTEWTNVTKAVPRFVGHYQPKLPGELGFYDLRNVATMREQAALAKKFGLTGFCFHFYWFGGTRLMETPILNFRNAEDIDFSYSLCWANENWSRRWDGAENELLISQVHSAEDDIAFMTYMAKTYFNDKRYIKVDGKPMLTIYRPDILPNVRATVKRWRQTAKKLGFPDIYLVATTSFGFTDYKKFGFDALSEFPPHAIQADTINTAITKYDERFAGGVFSYKSLVSWQKSRKDIPEGTVFPGVFPAWDNVARRPLAGHVFHESTPELYRNWLMLAMERVRKSNPSGQQFVMINAWNEWAEGAYLEPDRRFGHAYLWATASALEHSKGASGHSAKLARLARAHNDAFKPRGTHAIAAHLYYQDTIDDLVAELKGKADIDVYVTVPTSLDLDAFRSMLKAFPRSFVMPVSNCGRDILPFIKILRKASEHPYDWICKVHSKKSLHLGQGNLWRRELYKMLFDGLVTKGSKQSHALLPKSAKVGMVGPAGSLKTLNDAWTIQNNKNDMDQILSKLNLGRFTSDYTKHSFFAGTMFWFRPSALESIAKAKLSDEDFGVELGRVDGTPAHAMERLFGVICASKGLKLAELANADSVSVDISMAKRDRK